MTSVRIPADVDREDRLLSGLTGRQLLVLAAGVAVAAVALDTLRGLVPGPGLVAVVGPPVVLCLAMAFGRLDGLSGDRLAWLGIRRLIRPSQLVPAPEGLTRNPIRRRRRLGVLELPVEGLVDDVVDLGAAGSALVCRSSSLNFGLRTPEEQQALVATMASWLNSLSAPVQVLVRAERVDVEHLVQEIEREAPSLRHPALEAAARDHAAFLAGLAARHDVLRREVLLVFRDHGRPDAAVAAALHRRADDAASALGAAGVAVTPLDRAAAASALARAADPDAPVSESVLDWPDDEVVRGAVA
ncbi:MAG: PrgI family protein [Actinobacteria bacterium]|nr:PrgI family protein [Actinomycetota bacterium]